jgi:hypothetical protein
VNKKLLGGFGTVRLAVTAGDRTLALAGDIPTDHGRGRRALAIRYWLKPKAVTHRPSPLPSEYFWPSAPEKAERRWAVVPFRIPEFMAKSQ